MGSRKTVQTTAAPKVENGHVDVVCDLPRGPVVGGVQIDAGVTAGVDRAAWDRWHAEHIGSPAVMNGLIYARDAKA